MANPWFRLWGDMVNDPKWRTISRVSEQKIGDVISVYVHMMTCASNATERGRTQGWSDEDVATALDINTEQVEAIRLAMQGRVLDDDYLSGWDKRQPLREDGASERSKAFRDRKKNAETELQTQPNATERNQSLEKIREEEIREEKKEQKKEQKKERRATRLPTNWQPSVDDLNYARSKRSDLDAAGEAENFRDYWTAKAGKDATKEDWPATWRMWVRRANATPLNNRDNSRQKSTGLRDYAAANQEKVPC